MSTFILKLVFCSFLTFVAWKITSTFGSQLAPLSLVAMSVIWGIMFARYIVEIIPSVKYFAEKAATQKWQGKYYVFENCHIRFYLIDQTIWIPLRDLKQLMQPAFNERELRLLGEAHGPIPDPEHDEPGLSEEGLLRLLSNRTEHRRASEQMIRFRNWLLQNALPNVRRLPQSAANGQSRSEQ
ncbi:MAG: hypothetical protein V4805_08845 [Pseudomonadota bacterium]